MGTADRARLLLKRIEHARRPGLALAVLLLLGGCARSAVQLVSFKDPYFPEHVHVPLRDCAYRASPSGEIEAVGRALRSTDDGTLMQYLRVRMFWNPHPGKTFANATTTDALLHYVIANERGVTVYTGTGFAYPSQKNADTLAITLESGRLQLESQTGELNDPLGETRITGLLIARRDPIAAANLAREAELHGAH